MRPEIDPESAGYWAAANDGRLVVPRCTACGHRFFPPRRRCPRCWAPGVALEDASGRAEVLSFTVVRRNDVPPWRDRVPYVVAVVETDEGVRMTTSIVGASPEDVRIGMPVTVDFERIDEDVALPVFRPA